MSRYRKVDPRIWNDAKFRSLSAEAKMIFLYALTSPKQTMLGALPMHEEEIANAVMLKPFGKPSGQRCGQPFAELYRNGLLKADRDSGLMWVRNFLKYNPPDNPNVVKSWADVVDLLPECPLLAEIVNVAMDQCESRGEGFVKALPQRLIDIAKESPGNGMPNGSANGLTNGMPNQEQEQEQEQEKGAREDRSLTRVLAGETAPPAKEKSRGTRLTITQLPEEWRKEALGIDSTLDPELCFADFCDYWKAIGGSKAVKIDWLATWRGCIRSMPSYKRELFRKSTASVNKTISAEERELLEKRMGIRHGKNDTF